MTPRLSIVIVSYNSRGEIDGCLRSLTADALIPPSTSAGASREIVVVDNASTDGTPAHIRQRWPGIPLIEAGANLGFARATNIGIRQTTGELVLLLNPDTTVPPGAIDRLVSALQRDPHAAAAGPRIVDAHGRAELSFGRMISPLAELRQKLLVTGGAGLLRPVIERMTRRSRHVDWVSGACLLAFRADLEAVGLLDERFFLYTEDVDLCASLRARGRRILYAAEVEIVHQRGRSAAADPATTHAAYHQSRLAFYQKHHPAWVPALRVYLRLFAPRHR